VKWPLARGRGVGYGQAGEKLEKEKKKKKKKEKPQKRTHWLLLGVMSVLCRPAGGLDGVSVSVRRRASGAHRHKDL